MELSNEKRKAEALDRALNAIHEGDPSKGIQHAFNEGGAPLAELIVLSRRLELELKPQAPTRAYQAATRHRVMNVVRARQQARDRAERKARRRARRARLFRPAMALASAFLAVVMLLTGTGVVYAAGRSLPGDALYGLKRSIETARLSLALSDASRLALLNANLEERLDEIRQLSSTGRSADLSAAVGGYQVALDSLLQEVEQDGSQDAIDHASVMLDHHILVLESMEDRLPDAAQEGISNALDQSKHGMDVIQGLKNGIQPNELAPGLDPEATRGNGRPDDAPGGGPPSDNPGGGPPDNPPGGGPPGDQPGGGPPEDSPGGGPPSENPGGGPPAGNPGRGHN